MFGYELIEDKKLASAVTDITFTGLNITSDDDYLIVSEINGVANLEIYFNGTTTNYTTQNGNVNNTTETATRDNTSRMAAGSTSYKSHGETLIKLTKDGYITAISDILEEFNNATGGRIGNYYLTSRFTTSFISSINIKATTGNIGAGSRFKLYKVAAEKIAEFEVVGNQTTITLEDFEVTGDNELLLVSDIANNGISSDYFLYLNGITSTYYSQKYLISNVSYVGTRLNLATYCSALTSQNIVNYARIKITNRGIITSYTRGVCSVGTTTPYLEQAALSRTSTISTNVTKIDITSAQPSAIGNGSKFTLYKLY